MYLSIINKWWSQNSLEHHDVYTRWIPTPLVHSCSHSLFTLQLTCQQSYHNSYVVHYCIYTLWFIQYYSLDAKHHLVRVWNFIGYSKSTNSSITYNDNTYKFWATYSSLPQPTNPFWSGLQSQLWISDANYNLLSYAAITSDVLVELIIQGPTFIFGIPLPQPSVNSGNLDSSWHWMDTLLIYMTQGLIHFLARVLWLIIRLWRLCSSHRSHSPATGLILSSVWALVSGIRVPIRIYSLENETGSILWFLN